MVMSPSNADLYLRLPACRRILTTLTTAVNQTANPPPKITHMYGYVTEVATTEGAVRCSRQNSTVLPSLDKAPRTKKSQSVRTATAAIRPEALNFCVLFVTKKF